MFMVYETFDVGELPDSAKKAVLALIFKKGDRDLLKNYRPISLTNYDYKIIAFVLSRRLQNVIPKVINTDQSAYIKKRYIGCNARLVQDIGDYSEMFNKKGALLCLNFEKAFDTVNWDFMINTLKNIILVLILLNGLKCYITTPNLS